MVASKKTSASVKRQVNANNKPEMPSGVNRELWIEESAYFMAESRGFAPGFEQQDWSAATKEYDSGFSSAGTL